MGIFDHFNPFKNPLEINNFVKSSLIAHIHYIKTE